MLLILKCFFTGNYILNYVASQPKLAPFVIQALVQVIAKITKLGWFEVLKDQLIFRDIIADVKKFLQVGNNHSLLPFFSAWTSSFLVIDMSLSCYTLGWKKCEEHCLKQKIALQWRTRAGLILVWGLMPRSIYMLLQFFFFFSFSKVLFHSVAVKHEPLLSSRSI